MGNPHYSTCSLKWKLTYAYRVMGKHSEMLQ